MIVVLVLGSCKKETNTQPSNVNTLVYQAGPGFYSPATALIIFNGNLVAAHSDSVSQWNGSTWTTLGSGLSGTVNALTIYNGNLIAAGGNLVEMWNGASWQSIGAAFNNSVNALTVYNGNLIAGGNFDTNQHGVANKIAEWNGTKWSPIADSGMQVWSIGVNALTVFNGTSRL